MTKLIRLIVITGLISILPISAWSIPTQFGDTGLLSQPTANTLNAGNICVGLWANVSDDSVNTSTVMPFAITLGLGSFLEFYGSYPNILFNDEETQSGRGYVNLGTKIRILGTRSSLIKVAIDGQIQRQISNDPDLDGLNDYQGRMIASIANKRFGLHAYGSYKLNDDRIGVTYDNQVGFGGGIEFFPMERLRLIVEAESYSEAISGTDRTGEVTGGFQYFISPHLTLSLGVGYGLTDLSPDFRVLAGLSTCQGIGSYQTAKRVEQIDEAEAVEETDIQPVKVLKLKTLTPLLPMPSGVETPVATGVDATLPELSEPVSVAPKAVATPILSASGSTPTPVDVPKPLIKPLAPVAAPVIAAVPVSQPEPAPKVIPAPKAADLEVIVPEDAPVVMVDPAQNILTPGTVPAPSVNFPDSPSQVLIASAATPVLTSTTKTKLYRKFVLPEFTFEFGKYNLTDSGKAVLTEIAKELNTDGKWFIVRVDGHTDSTGPMPYNDKLSLQRAIEYAMYLIDKERLDPGRIFVKGFGENSPLASNATPEGRTLNRRVELLLLVRAESTQ